jgi:hypothetical protein
MNMTSLDGTRGKSAKRGGIRQNAAEFGKTVTQQNSAVTRQRQMCDMTDVLCELWLVMSVWWGPWWWWEEWAWAWGWALSGCSTIELKSSHIKFWNFEATKQLWQKKLNTDGDFQFLKQVQNPQKR